MAALALGTLLGVALVGAGLWLKSVHEAGMRRERDLARRDQSLVARLDAIHLARATLVEGRFNPAADRRFNNARADRDYESAFREAGVGAIGDDPADVARRIAASAVRQPLLVALWRLGGLRRLRESPGVGPGGGAESRPGALARPRPRSRGVGRPHRPRRDGPDRAGGGAARAVPGRIGGAVTRPGRGRDRLPGAGAPGASG